MLKYSFCLLLAVFFTSGCSIASDDEHPDAASKYFYEVLGIQEFGIGREEALDWIEANWSEQLLPYYLEIRRFAGTAPSAKGLSEILELKTGLKWQDYDALNQYTWALELENTSDYAEFKGTFHSHIDRRFVKYFEPERRFDIRLDEVTWGGVLQDGIPPLRQPKMLSVEEAHYLDDSNVVFGLELNGDARAYPKRILAWHEMFVDEVGGVSLAGVYCTLCGTVIAYDTEFDGIVHELGTSGFLYRSNKLMYDKATQSLWSTLEGSPVIGPLVGKGIQLEQYALVTTTWGEWKARHPDSKVLSLDTGHRRDYGEGVAYQSYFGTDARMFGTPFEDNRLKNKDEVLALRFSQNGEPPVVIYEGFLMENPIYHGELNGQPYVILTDASGANRVYAREITQKFESWDQQKTVVDASGEKWELTEEMLNANDGSELKRLPAHRAFWFGWHSAFPDTVLIH